MASTDSLRVLLVEDNPGDARYIEELLSESPEVSRRILPTGDGGVRAPSVVDSSSDRAERTEASGAGENPTAGEATADANPTAGEATSEEPTDEEPTVAGVTIVHETRLSSGLDRLDREGFDVVLLDLNLPDSTGLDTLSRLTDEQPNLPVVVLTGVSDRDTGIDALRRGAEEFLVKDEANADVLVRSVAHAIERKASERRLERQRERLAAINHLNRVVHGVTGAVIERSTREEIERITCERIAESASYAFAWIGELDTVTEEVRVRASADADDYLDAVEITVDPDEPTGHGPTGRALRTGEVHSIDDAREDPDYEPWSDAAAEHGVRSSVAIPIIHEESVYGVLNVYATRPRAFRDEERTVLRQLGEVVGHAIAAADRKRALLSDSVVELEVHVPEMLASVGAESVPSGTVTIERLLPIADGEHVVYTSVPSEDADLVERLVETVPYWQDARVVGEGEDDTRYELHLTEAPLASRIASLGGSIEWMIVTDGDVRFTAHLPQNLGVRRVVESIREEFPAAEPVARRQVTNPEHDVESDSASVLSSLTERQRTVLETAYFSGYFEWPRETSGEEAAELLDISPATFSQHLRTAERKSFEGLLDDGGDPDGPSA